LMHSQQLDRQMRSISRTASAESIANT
jgi:hypothetical protein